MAGAAVLTHHAHQFELTVRAGWGRLGHSPTQRSKPEAGAQDGLTSEADDSNRHEGRTNENVQRGQCSVAEISG